MSKPTKADAELFLRYFAIMRGDEDFKRAMRWFHEEFSEKELQSIQKEVSNGK